MMLMDCVRCSTKTCRTSNSCGAEKFEKGELISSYSETENQKIVQAAALLVDNGRAGTLSRIQEIIEFIKSMQYSRVGLAYCYGMEQDAARLKVHFKDRALICLQYHAPWVESPRMK